MDILKNVMLFTHLLGFAAVAGGLIFQIGKKTKTLGPVIVFGARWQAVSGSILYYLMRHDDIRPSIVGLKIVGVIIILALVEMNQKKDTISNKLFNWLLVIVIIQTLIALFISK